MTRSRLQIELTPGEYSDAKKRERQGILVELQQLLDRASAREAPWYMWLLWRRNGEHHHDLSRDDGTPVACPVPGCDAVRSVGGDGVGLERGRVDAVDLPASPVETALQQFPDFEADGAGDLGVPVGAGAVVEVDAPVAFRLDPLIEEARGDADGLRAGLAEAEQRVLALERLAAAAQAVALGVAPDDPRAGNVISGGKIAAAAIAVARAEQRSELGYREWFQLFREAGFVIESSDPLAVFLTSLTRSELVERVGERSGVYRIADTPT